MRNKAILFGSLLIAACPVLAQSGALEAVGKQLATDAATAAAPGVVKGAAQANQTLENAQKLKQNVENTPEAVKARAEQQAQEALKQKIESATPAEIKQGTKAVESAKKLKGQVDKAPQSAEAAGKAVKNKAKEKAAEKVIDLLR